MTEEQAYKIIDNLKDWNQGQVCADQEVQVLVDAKRKALTAAYDTLAELQGDKS